MASENRRSQSARVLGDPSEEPANRARPLRPSNAASDAFWSEKTIEQLAAEQGVDLPQDVDALIGDAAELWDDDADFERFVTGIHERRRLDREGEPSR